MGMRILAVKCAGAPLTKDGDARVAWKRAQVLPEAARRERVLTLSGGRGRTKMGRGRSGGAWCSARRRLGEE